MTLAGFGEYLLEKGRINANDLSTALQLQLAAIPSVGEFVGDFFFKEGLLTELTLQKAHVLRLNQSKISKKQLKELQDVEKPPIGEVLLALNLIDKDELETEILEYKTKQIAETASTLGVNQIEVLQRTHEELRKSIKKIQEIIEKQQSDLAARRWNLICKKYDESLSKEEEEELDSLDKRAADLRTSSTDYGTMKQKFNQWDERARRLETPF